MSNANVTFDDPSALLTFDASNVRSYRDDLHLSLVATRLASPEVRRQLTAAGTSKPFDVLPAAGVFGANASGKSTILLALADMRAIVASSFRAGSRTSGVYRRPFALDDGSKEQPTSFAVDLLLHGVHWQYGFEIDDKRVLSEYAYYYPKGRQSLVFTRELDEINFGAAFRSDGRSLHRVLRDNSLLLSVAGAAEENQLAPLFEWFLRNLRLANSANRGSRAIRTAEVVQDRHAKQRIMALVHAADLGVTDIARAPIDPDLAERMQRVLRILSGEEGDPETDDADQFVFEDSIRLKHLGVNGDVDLDPEDESQGTMVWIGLIGPVLDVLDGGHLLLADELDASLHPQLVALLVNLFQNPLTNPNCAQLIFNAHDITVLGDSDGGVLGRDQIWFTEKDNTGATKLYPLSDFGPRRDEAVQRRYLQGRYGAVPVVDPGQIAATMELVDS